MKVKNFKLEEWVSGKTSANLENISSYKLYINNILFSANLPCLESGEDQLLQVEVCDQCFIPGCNLGGYVQILAVQNQIIWKAPLSVEGDESSTRQYLPAGMLKYGTVFWPAETYLKFIATFDQSTNSLKLLKKDISYGQAYDLWRLHASNSICPGRNCNLSIIQIKEKVVTIHSENHNLSNSWEIYKTATNQWESTKIFSWTSIPLAAEKITLYFDVKDFTQWDSIFFDEKKFYFPIGDGYAWEVNKAFKGE
jgi:hypothetical protein